MLRTTEDALEAIAGATPAALFGPGAPGDPDAARRARRTYRILVALVHPDRARQAGLDGATAVCATARLNDLYAAWQATASATPGHAAAPHVVGARGTYPLESKVHTGEDLATYRSGAVFVTIERRNDAGLDRLTTATRRLEEAGLSAFAPHVTDRGRVGGRAWTAWSIPDGLVPLRAVRRAVPEGLDGRDWAWMARRILMTLDAAGVPHGAITPDTVLVHPGAHGVVLTGWGANSGPAADTDDVAALFDHMLRDDETRQRRFAARAAGLSPAVFLAEYDLLLTHLYGPRRYRPFALPDQARYAAGPGVRVGC